MKPRVHHFWAIEITTSPFSGTRKFFSSTTELPHVRLFKTRREARDYLRAEKAGPSAWAYQGEWAWNGGSRIYSGARVVRVRVTTKIVGRA